MLGCQPTEGWAKGDQLPARRVSRVAKFGMWMLRADETAPADVDAQVMAILNRLTVDEAVWSALRTQYEVSLFCGWFMEYGNEGVSVAADTMSALGSRGIPLDIDLYGGDNDKVPDVQR